MAAPLSRDPYKNYRFKVYFDSESDDNLIAAVNGVDGLSWTVEVITHPEGGDYHSDRKVPGGINFEAVTLSRGIINGRNSGQFQKWAEAVWNYSNSNPVKDMRRKLIILLCDDNGNKAVTYTLQECWVSAYNALPELSADGNEIAVESITVEHEGWTREVFV